MNIGAGPHWSDNIVAFDTETTGVDTANDRIVTATLAVLEADGNVLGAKEWLINPGVPIPKHASDVHGVTDERARTEGEDPKSAITSIVENLTRFAETRVAVAFNAAFDFSILAAEAKRHSITFDLPNLIVDPLVIDKQLWKFRKGKRTLTAVSELYGVELTNAHDATADAIAAGQLAQIMCRKYDELEPESITLRQQSWHRAQAASLEQYLKKTNPEDTVKRGWPIYE